MPEENSFDFGEGFEHIKSLVIDEVTFINSGYTYDEQQQTIQIPILDILSAK